jgi:hypothetical protein
MKKNTILWLISSNEQVGSVVVAIMGTGMSVSSMLNNRKPNQLNEWIFPFRHVSCMAKILVHWNSLPTFCHSFFGEQLSVTLVAMDIMSMSKEGRTVVHSSSLFWLLETETVKTSLICSKKASVRFTQSPLTGENVGYPQPAAASLLFRIFMRPRQRLAGLVSGAEQLLPLDYLKARGTPHRPSWLISLGLLANPCFSGGSRTLPECFLASIYSLV